MGSTEESKKRLAEIMANQVTARRALRAVIAEARRRTPIQQVPDAYLPLFEKRLAQVLYEERAQLTEIPTVWTNRFH